jgi:hypothetical protein
VHEVEKPWRRTEKYGEEEAQSNSNTTQLLLAVVVALARMIFAMASAFGLGLVQGARY